MTEQPEKKHRTNPLWRHRWGRLTGSAQRWAIVLVVAIAGTASISVARADEAQARSLFKAMSDYLAGQKAISFDYDSSLEIVSTQQQKIGSSLFRVGGNLFPAATLSGRRRVSNRLHTQRGQPIQRGGRLSLARQTFVNAGLRPPPPAAGGVDKAFAHQPCLPPCVRRKRMAEPPSPTAQPSLPTPNSEEAVY